MKRTHKCNQVTSELIGQEISVVGWIHRRRDHGGVIFFDLRDEDGIVQVVYNPESKDSFSLAETCRNEYVIFSSGLVRKRPDGTENSNLETDNPGTIKYEIKASNDNRKCKYENFILAGPSCDSHDIIYEKNPCYLPNNIKIGDKLRIFSTGAYTTVYNTHFNGLDLLEESYLD